MDFFIFYTIKAVNRTRNSRAYATKLINCMDLLNLISYKHNLEYLMNKLVIGIAEFNLSVAYKTSVHSVTGRNLNLARSDFAIWKPLENY